MITKGQIRKMSGNQSYTRGEQIYRRGGVLQFTVEVDDYAEYEDLVALVEGSRGNLYQVSMSVSLLDDEIEEADCDCPAFESYSGICKHCVAVLLKYMEYCEAEQQEEFSRINGQNLLESGRFNIQKGIKPATTPAFMQLLKRKEEAHILPLLEQESYGKVQLEPTIHCEATNIYVSFRIGITQMYVVKDVFELIRLIHRRGRHRYGKNLEFLHSIEAFDEASRPLVRFIEKWTRENEDKYRSTSYYGYYNYGRSDAKSKEMYLGTDEVEGYLNLMRGQVFPMHVCGMANTMWQISETPIPKKMKLTGEKNGVRMELPFFAGYAADKSNIFFYEDKVYIEPLPQNEIIREVMEAMQQTPNKTAFIENADIPAFCRELLPTLEAYYECAMIDFDKEQYGIESPEFCIYLDAPQSNMITCRPTAKYGEKEYSLYETSDVSLRSMEEEEAVRKLVHEYGNAFDNESGSVVAIDDEEIIFELLVYGVSRMQQVAEVFVSDAIKRMEVKPAPKITVGVSIESGLMNLSLDSGEMSREELIEVLSRYNRKKKFYRLKDGSFINAENSGLEEILELKEGLQITDKQLKQDQIQFEKYRSLYVDAQLKESSAIASVRDKGFRELVRNMKTVEDNDFEVPSSLEGTLREYQKRGFLWLKTLKHNGFGGILADDMGLGKTLQVITFLRSEYEENPKCGKILIVTPASLVFNWYEEFQKFAPELKTNMILGSAAQRHQMICELSEGEIAITSYDLLKRDIKVYEDVIFAAEFIDEAQYIKNHNTQAAKVVKDVHASFKVALTGTPVENRLSELWSIFDFLMPGFLYSYKKFREELETPIVQSQDEVATERLRKMIHPFVLRRLKKEVLKDLPDKLEENVYAKMEREQQKIYDAHVQRLKLLLDKQTEEEFKSSKIVVLSELTKLRQLCCDPALILEGYKGGSAKKEMCITFIQNAVDNGHKVLLFSQFTTMLGELAEELEKAGISHYMLTGSTSKEKRRQLVNAFNQDDTSVFCISLKAGGTGLNLTAADVVIHYDPWWNLAVQNQATDRAHRIGQEHVVNVYKLIVKGSIEENIVKMQEKKKELADQILSGEGMDGGSFTREALLEILNG